MTALSWMDRAQCAGDDWFVNLEVADQLEICATCTVRTECAIYGMTRNTAYEASQGPAYGGLFPEQLARLAARRRRFEAVA